MKTDSHGNPLPPPKTVQRDATKEDIQEVVQSTLFLVELTVAKKKGAIVTYSVEDKEAIITHEGKTKILKG